MFSVLGDDVDGQHGPGAKDTLPGQGLCQFLFYPVDGNIYVVNTDGALTGPSPLGLGGWDLSSPSGCIIHAGTSRASQGGQALPWTYVVDLFVDVSLPASATNKFHVYSYTQNGSGWFDSGTQTWKYSGYWWNVLQ
jgi:hypothetical protein